MSVTKVNAALFGWQSREPWHDLESGREHTLLTGIYLLFYEDGRVEGLESPSLFIQIKELISCTMQGTYAVNEDEIALNWTRQSLPQKRTLPDCPNQHYPHSIPSYLMGGEQTVFFNGKSIEVHAIRMTLLDGNPDFLID